MPRWRTPQQTPPRPLNRPADLPPELITPPEVQLVGGRDPEALTAASPVTYVAAGAPPFLLIHGDNVVAYAHSERLAEALTAAGVPVRLVPVPCADHIVKGHDDIDAALRP